MVPSANPGQNHNYGFRARPLLDWARVGRVLTQREMATVIVIIGDVLAQPSHSVAFAEDDKVVQQFPVATLHPALHHTILPRASIRCPHGLDAEGFHGGHPRRAEDRVAVEEQTLRRGIVGKGFDGHRSAPHLSVVSFSEEKRAAAGWLRVLNSNEGIAE